MLVRDGTNVCYVCVIKSVNKKKKKSNNGTVHSNGHSLNGNGNHKNGSGNNKSSEEVQLMSSSNMDK